MSRRLYALCALVVCLSLAGSAAAGPGYLLTDNASVYWTLDEASGTRVNSLGTGNLTDNNTVTGAAGAAANLGTSSAFTRANSEYLSLTDRAEVSTGDIDFTLAAWVYLASKPAGQMVVAAKSTGSTNREYKLFWNNTADAIQFTIFNSAGTSVGTITALATPALSTWYLIVVYHDAANNLLGASVNGAAYSTAATSGAPADTTSNFKLGAENNTAANFWDGRLDAVGLWKKVMPIGEVGELWNSGAGCEYNWSGCAPTPTPTASNTPVPPTATDTPTNTPIPPTATDTPTNTPIPPTATDTPTNTPIPPTATDTPTNTPIPPTATDTPTNTPIPPTATDTPTNTPIPPTATQTLTPEPTVCPATSTAATATASPPWQQDITLPGCASLLWRRQWTFGQLFQGLSVLALGGVLGLRWLRVLPKGAA